MSSTPDSLTAAIRDRAELEDIVCYGLTAHAAAGYPLPPATGADDSDQKMTTRAKLQPDKLIVRVAVRVHTVDAALTVDIGAVYSTPSILDDPPQAIARFIADSAIPTIYPFVRETIAAMSRRIGGEHYMIASLEPPRVSNAILDSMADDVARHQQAVITELRRP